MINFLSEKPTRNLIRYEILHRKLGSTQCFLTPIVSKSNIRRKFGVFERLRHNMYVVCVCVCVWWKSHGRGCVDSEKQISQPLQPPVLSLNVTFISTLSTLTPQGLVASSRMFSIKWQIISLSERISAKVWKSFFLPLTIYSKSRKELLFFGFLIRI